MTHAPDHKTHHSCNSCYRSLPIAFFGRIAYKKSGISSTCTKCRNEAYSKYVCDKAGWTPKVHTPDLIYNVNRHNTNILKEASTIDMELVGYGVKDKCLYKIKIYKGLYMGKVFQIYKGDSLHWGMELNLNDTGIAMITKLLKLDFIRLERTELDLLNVKTLIYDLGH